MKNAPSLEALTFSVKKRFLEMYKKANAGHIGCSLSCAEILVFIRFAWMQKTDELILSKGHAAAALYSVLIEDGTLAKEEIESFYKDGTFLAAHPPPGRIKGIPFATGSLGHGLSLTAGMALAAKLKKKPKRLFFCITSDGELDEGSVWEAMLFINHHKLYNVVWLIDRNLIQGIGRTEDVLALEPLEQKLKAFGFFVVNADGHDFRSLMEAKEKSLNQPANSMPKAILCKTVKGNGISFMRDTVDCHYRPMTEEQYKKALAELNDFYIGSQPLI